jgi:hypothetical protein
MRIVVGVLYITKVLELTISSAGTPLAILSLDGTGKRVQFLGARYMMSCEA